ncbi:MAG: 50S ribosomal protein L15e [Candidatus Micrarchaeota archaeon]|nr:50S ribosomal protein L15e [Candidatus Micrarchaeota archaeon]
MGFYKYMAEAFQKEYKEKSGEYKQRLIKWRSEGPIERVEKPLNIARARTLGYKAKKGYVVVRVRVPKGKRKVPKPVRGRKPSHSGRFFSAQVSDQMIAEQRANAKFNSLEVLNSYWVGEDGKHKYFEVILVDPLRKEVCTQAINRRGRVYRGLTSAGRRARGLRFKGKRRPKL